MTRGSISGEGNTPTETTKSSDKKRLRQVGTRPGESNGPGVRAAHPDAGADKVEYHSRVDQNSADSRPAYDSVKQGTDGVGDGDSAFGRLGAIGIATITGLTIHACVAEHVDESADTAQIGVVAASFGIDDDE